MQVRKMLYVNDVKKSSAKEGQAKSLSVGSWYGICKYLKTSSSENTGSGVPSNTFTPFYSMQRAVQHVCEHQEIALANMVKGTKLD